jgi:hypothetical protein
MLNLIKSAFTNIFSGIINLVAGYVKIIVVISIICFFVLKFYIG